jgi:hypothetical protein
MVETVGRGKQKVVYGRRKHGKTVRRWEGERY